MNARAAAREAAARLAAAGIPDAAFEAELLVRTAGGLSRASYFAGASLDGAALRRLEELLDRRLRREPTAYLVGQWEFYGRPFLVTPATLIPRPETELLVEVACGEIDRRGGRVLVVDVGTGCGCIAVTVACERPATAVVATDISAEAVAVARENARRLRVRVQFVAADLLGPIRRADLVVANLPYIPTSELQALAPELRDWEPWVALDGGPSGTELVEQLLAQAASRSVAVVAVEVGFGQAERVARCAAELGATVEIRRDLGGVDRVVLARWR